VNKGGAAMRKGKLIGRIFEIAVVFVMIGSILGGSTNIVNATSEKTTIYVTDSSPWFTKGSNSGHPEYWHSYTYSGHTYIWTYVGGMSGNPSQPDCWAEFRPYLSQSGQYDVYVCFYADPQNSHQVAHIIYYDGDSTTVNVDQYASSYFTWREVKLGTWNFLSGANACVKITDATGEPYDGYRTLNVDTVKFVKVNQPPSSAPVHISPFDGGTGVSLTPTFQWGSVANADYYALYISEPPYGQANLVFDSEEDYGPIYGASFILPSGILSEGVTYRWNMSAWNEAGRGPISSSWSFTTQAQGNNPPNTPSNPWPVNHATGVSINSDLSWIGGDPDSGDTVTYDVYFGTSSTPSLVSNDQLGITYDPGTLAYNTKYYWKVIATDSHGASTTGPLWDFITQSEPSLGTWYVDDDLVDYPSADFTKIQDAVDAASSGDTIIVYPGTYSENVDVNKSLTIQSENGAETTFVQAANPDDDVFKVTADYVEINGFTVTGSTTWLKAGVMVEKEVVHCTLLNNVVSNNSLGICLGLYSSNNVLDGNTVMDNHWCGIEFHTSSHNTLRNNVILDNHHNLDVRGGGPLGLISYIHDIDTSNTVNGEPIQYLVNEDGIVIDSTWNIGYLGLVDCTNIVVKDLTLNNYNGQGILLAYSANSRVEDVNISNNCYYGIMLSHSCNIGLTNNVAFNNGNGIELDYSSSCTLINNTASNNDLYGILLHDSNDNILQGNMASGNTLGIYLDDSPNNTLADNTMLGNERNFGVMGGQLADFIQNIDISNTANGKPVQYLVNRKDLVIDSNWDVGYLGVVDCKNIVIEGLSLSNNEQGVLLAYSSDSRIESTTAQNNWHGLVLIGSSNNTLSNNLFLDNYGHGIELCSSNHNVLINNICSNNGIGAFSNGSGIDLLECYSNTLNGNILSNNDRGVCLSYSDNNSIYLNNFVDNTYNVISQGSNNAYNSPEEITYNYNANTYTNYLGNYWGDYMGSDANGDGIGDTPYPIDSDADNYPLREPVENYVPIGYAILVAGQSGWSTRLAINYNANNAYRVLRNLGYDDDRILYLNSNIPQDVDGDGYDEVDLSSSLNHFLDAIEWAKQRVNTDAPLVLYLIGHGYNDPGIFFFDEPSTNGITPSLLNNLLEAFPEQTSMFIGIDACYSGIFITPEAGTISMPNVSRVIITSAHDDQKKWAAVSGRLFFSDDFWRNLHRGLNVKNAFVQTGDMTYSWLDDNGDSVGHPPNLLEDDGKLAERMRIGSPGIENIPLKPFTLAELFSPGELRIYDSQGMVTGLVNGEVIEEIPNSMYDSESESVVVFDAMDNYEYGVVGLETEIYGLSIASNKAGDTQTFTATDIPTAPGTVHQYTIDWEALSEGGAGVTIEIDSDGDGDFEDTFTADDELTQDEFMLRTATTIDFDPDTLNLKTKDNYVTVYIELPKGYDVAKIDVSSIRLNGTVPALAKPTQVGDYDKDGMPDLMVKFDRAAVGGILTAGEQVEITVTGEVAGIGFEGSDTIRVISK
jgi:parallel beta-helix repeat protein